MLKYFRIVIGYKDDEYIEIDENELPKAIYLFLEGSGRGIFSGGAIRGQDIVKIIPDWHRVMGWNKGYKMTTYEFEDVKPFEKEYRETYNKAKEVVQYTLQTGKKELLSQPLSESTKLLLE